MANPASDIRAALAEALDESGFPTDEKVAADSWEEPLAADEGASAEAPADELSKGETFSLFDSPEADEVQDELPDEYWGVPLDGIPDETRKAILAHFEQQDSTIRKLQERLSKEPDAPPPAPEVTEEVTDEALLLALGFDPDEWETQQLAPKILPLARTVLDLEDKVDSLVQKETVNTVQTQWNSQLDELESVHGKLPFDRVQVLRYAIEENIASPFEVYFKLSAPIKREQREVENVVTKARRDAARKAEAGGVKPRSAASTGEVIDPKTTSLRDATRIAMAEAEKETGLSFKSLFGRKVQAD